MAQLEYGDYYRFVVSVGIALIAIAAALPWLFLREPFDLAIEVSNLASLTPSAQSILLQRQHMVATILRVIPYVSFTSGLVGIFMVVFGLWQWRKRQSIRDQGEELEVEKLKREIERMTPEEIQAKAREEVAVSEDSLPPIEPEPADLSTSVNAYLAAERALLERIRACFGASVKIEPHSRLAGVEYDAILRTSDPTISRVIVEIKYIRRGFKYGWLSESINALTAKTALYSNALSRPARGILIIILASSDKTLPQKAVELTARLLREKRSRSRHVRVHTIEERDIASIDCKQLRQMLLS